ALDGLLGADVGLRDSGANRDRDARADEIDTAAREELARRDQLIDRVCREDDDIGGLAGLDALRDIDATSRFGRDPAAACMPILARERGEQLAGRHRGKKLQWTLGHAGATLHRARPRARQPPRY